MRKIALVTGAGRGIGRAIALRLADDGCDVWACYAANDEKAAEVRREIEAKGRACTLLKFDVGSREEAAAALRPAIEGLRKGEERLWAVVNNAGVVRDALLAWMKPEEWDAVIRTNLDGLYNVTRPALDELMRQRGGRVVNMTSLAGRAGNTGQTNYAASKAGVIGFTKSLAKEVARMGITVNAVAAGFVDTDMTAALPADELRKTIPMRRFGRPAEVAAVVSFLCGEEASYVTGAVVDVNGGLW